MLTIEYLKSVLDYVDGDLIWKNDSRQRQQWNGNFAGKVAGYLMPKKGYKIITFRPNGSNGLNKTVYLLTHRIVFALHHGFWPKSVDHINQIKTDNRIDNLRESSPWHQMGNTKLQIGSKTGRRGITERYGRFIVRIGSKGKRHNIGRFGTLDEAIIAWDNAVRRLVGDWKPA